MIKTTTSNHFFGGLVCAGFGVGINGLLAAFSEPRISPGTVFDTPFIRKFVVTFLGVLI